MNREETALALRKKGYNCAQATACVFAEEAGMDEKTLFRVTEGLGGGLGTTKGACGALNAACILAGIRKSTANLEHPDSKAATFMLVRQIVNGFEKETGATVCADLKGLKTGHMLYACEDCIRLAVRLTEQIVFEDAE